MVFPDLYGLGRRAVKAAALTTSHQTPGRSSSRVCTEHRGWCRQWSGDLLFPNPRHKILK